MFPLKETAFTPERIEQTHEMLGDMEHHKRAGFLESLYVRYLRELKDPNTWLVRSAMRAAIDVIGLLDKFDVEIPSVERDDHGHKIAKIITGTRRRFASHIAKIERMTGPAELDVSEIVSDPSFLPETHIPDRAYEQRMLKAATLLQFINEHISEDHPCRGSFKGQDNEWLALQDSEDEGTRLKDYGQLEIDARKRAKNCAIHLKGHDTFSSFDPDSSRFIEQFREGEGWKLHAEESQVMHFVYFTYCNNDYVFEWVTDEGSDEIKDYRLRSSR